MHSIERQVDDFDLFLTPLGNIHEQLDMVIKYMPRKTMEEKERVLTRTREQTRRVISLLNDLIDLSTIETGREWMNPEPVRIDPEEIERLQIPLTISTRDHWAFREQVIRTQTERGRFD